jgi:cytochrome c biogenesis protein CcmG/thiol:disulfide interchange protein DsbE
MPRRPILLALAAAFVTTAIVLAVVTLSRPADSGGIARDAPAPPVVGETLDGAAFDLAALRGSPVIVNFWGPSCVPCRDEFPLFRAKLAQYADDGLVIVGVLMHDPPEPARTFVEEFEATWPTVLDPNGVIREAYRTLARPTSFFIDRDGVLRSIQIGEVREADFDRQYAQIAS